MCIQHRRLNIARSVNIRQIIVEWLDVVTFCISKETTMQARRRLHRTSDRSTRRVKRRENVFRQILGKESKEWLFFADFWKLIQKYWKNDNSKKYWYNLIDETNALRRTHSECGLANYMIDGYLRYQRDEIERRK